MTILDLTRGRIYSWFAPLIVPFYRERSDFVHRMTKREQKIDLSRMESPITLVHGATPSCWKFHDEQVVKQGRIIMLHCNELNFQTFENFIYIVFTKCEFVTKHAYENIDFPLFYIFCTYIQWDIFLINIRYFIWELKSSFLNFIKISILYKLY